MNRINKIISLALLISLLQIYNLAYSQEKTKYKDLKEAIFSSQKLRGSYGPGSVNWINGGDKYSYTIFNKDTRKNEIHVFNPSTLEDEVIFGSDSITFPGTEENFSYNSFQWAKDSKHLVFQTHFKRIYRRSGTADYYVYSLEDKTLILAAKGARTAELSPDGSMIGYERDGNIFVYSFDEDKEIQLTNDAAENIFNGHYDWVYEEEFGQAQAWRWSADSRYIAYWQTDESEVPIFQMTNYEGQHPEYVKIPYPKVGDPNPKVKIGILDVKSGKNIWATTDESGDFYIPRIYWTSRPNVLAVMTLNRKQNDMKLYFFNIKSQQHNLVFEETSDTWVDIYDFYARVNDMISFPDGVEEFFWISDRDGFQHIYRYDYKGKLINQITSGNWTVLKLHGIDLDNKTVFYESTEVSPLQPQLYSIKFDGSNKKRISTAEGNHNFNFSPNTKYFIDSYSSTSTPVQVELWSSEKGLLKKLEDNKSVTEYIASHAYSPKELFQIKTSDGAVLDCSVIKPYEFDSTKKYPVVFTIYGGPGSQGVYNSFESNGFKQFLSQKGYLTVDINNRGNANYGRDFMKRVYEHLGKWESNDFAEFARYLKTLSYVDSNKIAIMGTSYGGYITTYTMFKYPELFKVGIANSPGCTDWRLYDDIYTERYMGLKDENKSGYDESSSLTYARNLKGHLLLVHSAMDENVHIQNTMQLLTALTNAGKDADLRIYPPGAHGAIYNLQSALVMYSVYYNYLDRFFNDGKDQININE